MDPFLAVSSYLNASRSAIDTKEYEYFKLPSGLTVVTVHEKGGETKKSAIALAVGGLAGSFSDEEARQGLAHFCEHAMFMGSAQYPKENDYDGFLSTHGGQSNAYTDNEVTVYQAEVACTSLAVDGALSRLSAFFVAPMFSAGSVEREVQAVDTEYRRASREDGSRLSQMQAHSFARSHIYSRWGWGNGESVWGRKEGVDGVEVVAKKGSANDVPALIADLKSYHSRTYLAHHMVLCIRADGVALRPAISDAVGEEMTGLQVLKRLVCRHFEAVPAAPPSASPKAGNSAQAEELSVPDPAGTIITRTGEGRNVEDTLTALAVHHTGKANGCNSASVRLFGPPASPFPRGSTIVYFLSPVSSRHSINITWALPPLHPGPWLRSGPEHLLSHILGHEAAGTLLPALRDAGWALELYAGVAGEGGVDSSSVATLFGVTITTTPAGVCAWREVVCAVQAYIVHALCGGINVSDDIVPAGGAPETARSTYSAAAAAASEPFVDGVQYELMSGHSVPGSTLLRLTARMESLSWAWQESSGDSLLAYNYGDAPDPWTHVSEIAAGLARGAATPASALVSAAGVFGPIPSGPFHSHPSEAVVTDPSRFCPAMAAFLAAHLHPSNARVDIVSPLCGVSKDVEGREEEGGGVGAEGGDEEEDEDEDEDDDDDTEAGSMLPDSRLALRVSVETDRQGTDEEKGEEEMSGDEEMNEADLLTDSEAAALVKLVEPYFFSPYACAPIDSGTLQQWTRPPPIGQGQGKAYNAAIKAARCTPKLRAVLASLALPPRNPYTTTDFTMHVPEDTNDEPQEIARASYVLQNGELVEHIEDEKGSHKSSPECVVIAPCVITRLWHAPNGSFRSPRSDVRAMIYQPAQYGDAHACAAADVWAAMVSERVNNDVYLASMAGLDGSVDSRPRHGMKVSAAGMSQHVGAILGRLIAALTCTSGGGDEMEEEEEHAPVIKRAAPSRGKGKGPQSTSQNVSSDGDPFGVYDADRLDRWTDAVLEEYEDALLAPGTQAAALVFRKLVEQATPGGHVGSIQARTEALDSLAEAGVASKGGKGWTALLAAFLGVQLRGGQTGATKVPRLPLPSGAPSDKPVPCLWSFSPNKPIIIDMLVVGNETAESAQRHMATVAVPVLRAARRWLKDVQSLSLTQASALALEAGTWDPCPLPPALINRENAAVDAFLITPSPYAFTGEETDETRKLVLLGEYGGYALLYPPAALALPISMPIARYVEAAEREGEVNSVVQMIAWAGSDAHMYCDRDVILSFLREISQAQHSAFSSMQMKQWPAVRRNALLSFLAHLCSEPFFDSLRTQQQLGYEVFCGVVDMGSAGAGGGHASGGGAGGTQGCAMGLQYTVESAAHTAADVEARILAFWSEWLVTLSALDGAALDGRLEAWATQHVQPHENLGDAADDAWGQIRRGCCAFYGLRRANEVACLTGKEVVGPRPPSHVGFPDTNKQYSCTWPRLQHAELLAFARLLLSRQDEGTVGAVDPAFVSVHIVGATLSPAAGQGGSMQHVHSHGEGGFGCSQRDDHPDDGE